MTFKSLDIGDRFKLPHIEDEIFMKTNDVYDQDPWYGILVNSVSLATGLTDQMGLDWEVIKCNNELSQEQMEDNGK